VPPVIQRVRVITKACGSRSLDSLRLGGLAMSFGGFIVYLRALISACRARISLLISPAMVPGGQGLVSRPGGYGVRDHQHRGKSSWWLWRSKALVPAHRSGGQWWRPYSQQVQQPWRPAQTSYDLSTHLICTNDRKRPRCDATGRLPKTFATRTYSRSDGEDVPLSQTARGTQGPTESGI
jgi:hypothetical protein